MKGQGDGIANRQVAARRRFLDRADGRVWGRRIDLQAAEGGDGVGEIGRTGRIADGAAARYVNTSDGQGGGRLVAGPHRIGETQGIAARAAAIGGNTAVVEGERRVTTYGYGGAELKRD